MLQRDDLLRMARIINYDRYFVPSLGNMNDPSFEYEYVSAAVHKPLDNGCHCVIWQDWKKAQRGSANDPCLTKTNMENKQQHGEVRARKEMKTSELRTMLETMPLSFKFDDGIEVIVLPKLPSDPHKVYVKQGDLQYTEQYSIPYESELHKKWFNTERANSEVGQDWRELLSLNGFGTSETTMNVLYKFFEGVYTGDMEQFKTTPELIDEKLKEKAGVYATLPVKKRIKKVPDWYDHLTVHDIEGQKMVCIKDPANGNIIRIAKYYTGRFIKDGFTFATKEEYKEQQKAKLKARKEKSKKYYEDQSWEYKGPKQPNKPKGVPGSPYLKHQLIKVWPRDDNGQMLTDEDYEKITVKKLVPQYEYRPVVWNLKVNGVLTEVIPFNKKVFIGNKEEWVTYERPVRPVIKTVKRLQIPSHMSMELKKAMERPLIQGDGKRVLRTIRNKQFTHDKYKKYYMEKEDVKQPVYETYLVTKRDGHGKVVNVTKRKLVY